jgi:hypothetical protein
MGSLAITITTLGDKYYLTLQFFNISIAYFDDILWQFTIESNGKTNVGPMKLRLYRPAVGCSFYREQSAVKATVLPVVMHHRTVTC